MHKVKAVRDITVADLFPDSFIVRVLTIEKGLVVVLEGATGLADFDHPSATGGITVTFDIING